MIVISKDIMDGRVCHFCGRNASAANTLTAHTLGQGVTLPFRGPKAFECKSCFNAVTVQSGGDRTYRNRLRADCETAEGRLAQLRRTEEWEAKYNSSFSGRVAAGNRAMKESAQLKTSSFLELERCLGVVWSVALATKKLGRAPTKKEIRVYQVGVQKVRGVVFPEVSGEVLPPSCFRLRSGSGTTVDHVMEFDSDEMQLRPGQVADTARALTKVAMPAVVKQVATQHTNEDGTTADGPDVVLVGMRSSKCTIAVIEAGADDDCEAQVVDLLSGPVRCIMKRGGSTLRTLKRTVSDDKSSDIGEGTVLSSSASTNKRPRISQNKLSKKLGTPKAPRVAVDSAENMIGALQILLAQAENLVDQVAGRGLLVVTPKALSFMIEKVSNKLTHDTSHMIMEAERAEQLKELEVSLHQVVAKLGWAFAAVSAFDSPKCDPCDIVKALVQMVQSAPTVGIGNYSIPEVVATMVAQKCWTSRLAQGGEDRCLELMAAGATVEGTSLYKLSFGIGDLEVRLSEAALRGLQVECVAKALTSFMKEAPNAKAYSNTEGRDITCVKRLDTFVRAAGVLPVSSWLVEGLADDLASLCVVFRPKLDAETAEKARAHISQTSKRFTSKGIKNGSMVTECMSKLDACILGFKLNQQCASNLESLVAKRLPHMTKNITVELEALKEQFDQYSSAVAEYRSAISVVAADFDGDHHELLAKAKAHVSHFFDAKSADLLNHIAKVTSDGLMRMAAAMDTLIDSPGPAEACLTDAKASFTGVACNQMSVWCFDKVCIDGDSVANFKKTEENRVDGVALLVKLFDNACVFATREACDSRDLKTWLDLPAAASIKYQEWFPAFAPLEVVQVVSESFDVFYKSCIRLERLGYEKWLTAHCSPLVATAFVSDIGSTDTPCSSGQDELQEIKSPWLENLADAMDANLIGGSLPALGDLDRALIMRFVQERRYDVFGAAAMLCYAMLCYAMLCYVVLCYVMLCYER